MKTAIAIGAHPDDIEFYMAGTLLLLKKAGWVQWNPHPHQPMRLGRARLVI